MDGGCCIARYAGGAAYDASQVRRIMLKFRPIAPKPATTGSVSSGSSIDTVPRSGRGKKKCNTANNSRNSVKRGNNGFGNRKRKALAAEDKVDAVVVTLPLLPETPDQKEAPARQSQVGSVLHLQTKNVPTWLCFGSCSNVKDCDQMMASRGSSVPANRTAGMVKSCVTVECVTDTWVDGDGLGCTDEKRRVNLGRDTCPGFISDVFGRVTWTNEAYRDMVGLQAGDKMVVCLVAKEMVHVKALAGRQAFTCSVRVHHCDNTYRSCNGKEASPITVPCDVWRMDCGGFAWRLDVETALCLGR